MRRKMQTVEELTSPNKVCYTCEESKPRLEFGVLRKSRDGLNYNCKKCHSKMLRDWHAVNTYDVTPEYIEELRKQQKNRCAICRCRFVEGTERKRGNMVVDHDHETDKVRGLLCQKCNRALGTFGDNADGVMRVVAYLLESSGEF